MMFFSMMKGGCDITITRYVAPIQKEDFLLIQSLVNEKNAMSTPIETDVTPCQKDIIQLLIDSGDGIHNCNERNWTVLHYASHKGWTEVVTFLVNKEAVNIDVRNADGATPILLAASKKHFDIVKLFLDSGADVNHCNEDGWTVLHHAAENGWTEIVKYFVDKKFNLDVKNSVGYTPLLLAARRSFKFVVELLIKSCADLNCCNNRKWNVLHFACDRGWLNIVQWLCEKNLGIDAKTSFGDTPLIIAARHSHEHITKLLIDLGADVNCCNKDKWSLLHYASEEGWTDAVQSLVNKRVDLDAKNVDGNTPLLIAAQQLHKDMIELLINSGANINTRDAAGYTPLHIGVEKNRIDIVDLLLKAGADCNCENGNGETPFNVATKNCNAEQIKLCIENGAYMEPIDYDRIFKSPDLKEIVLQDIKICMQVIINKYNNKDLPTLYSLISPSNLLPRIRLMKIKNTSVTAQEIERAVTHEIQTKGYCNLMLVRPIVLSLLVLNSVNNNIHNKKKRFKF